METLTKLPCHLAKRSTSPFLPTLQNGWTALANAAFRGHLQVARLLLAAGADIDARNHNVRTRRRGADGGMADALGK